MAFDLLVRGGTLVDGSAGAKPIRADVGINGERIAAVGLLEDARGAPAEAKSVIDASGRVVSPGFIDVHVHGEAALLDGGDRYAEVAQGVTTQLMAPDGFGWARLDEARARELWEYTLFAYGEVDLCPPWRSIADYLSQFERTSPCNVVAQVPHCAVRVEVMGWQARAATDDEIAAMERITHAWMEAGARALNLGLDYQPSANADLRELVALCRVAAKYGGIYAAHQRYQLLGRGGAWDETIELSRAAEIPVHVSHERVMTESAGALERVEREQIDLTFESYLYAAGMTHLTMMLPMDMQEGAPQQVLQRLRQPEIRERAVAHLASALGDGEQTCGFTRSGRHVGRTLATIAAEQGRAVADAAYDLLLEEEGLQAFVMPWGLSPEDVDATLAATCEHPRMMVASDGIYNVPHPHPRGTGCFARVLGEMVRERGLLTLSDAIYKMSGFPAERFGLRGRGRVADGHPADLVVFDPESVGAGSTFAEPKLPPTGIGDVVVDGVAVIADGTPTGATPGQLVRG